MLKWGVRAVSWLMLVFVTLYAVGALVLSDERRVSRSIDIAASPTAVFNVVNDMHAFNAWSPWTDLAADTRYRYSGPRSGVGAAMSWRSSDPMVGEGSQLIVLSEPVERVRMRMQFGAGRTAMSEVHLTPNPTGGTTVTWTLALDFDGNILQRYVGAFVQDGVIGRDYERGLANLKALMEGRPPPRGAGAMQDAAVAGQAAPRG